MFSEELYKDLEDNTLSVSFFTSDVTIPFTLRKHSVTLMGYRMNPQMWLDVAAATAKSRGWRWDSIVITDKRNDIVAMRVSLASSVLHTKCMDWDKEKGWQS